MYDVPHALLMHKLYSGCRDEKELTEGKKDRRQRQRSREHSHSVRNACKEVSVQPIYVRVVCRIHRRVAMIIFACSNSSAAVTVSDASANVQHQIE